MEGLIVSIYHFLLKLPSDLLVIFVSILIVIVYKFVLSVWHKNITKINNVCEKIDKLEEKLGDKYEDIIKETTTLQDKLKQLEEDKLKDLEELLKSFNEENKKSIKDSEEKIYNKIAEIKNEIKNIEITMVRVLERLEPYSITLKGLK